MWTTLDAHIGPPIGVEWGTAPTGHACQNTHASRHSLGLELAIEFCIVRLVAVAGWKTVRFLKDKEDV